MSELFTTAALSVLLVSEGQTVTRGSPVGQQGSSGCAPYKHVHFDARTGINPADPARSGASYPLGNLVGLTWRAGCPVGASADTKSCGRVVGPALAGDAKQAEVRFQLGRGIELSRPEYILAAGVRPKQFTTLFASVLRAFHPRHARRRATAGDTAAEQAAKLKKNVPYKVSKQLVELFGALGTTSWSSLRWRTRSRGNGTRSAATTTWSRTTTSSTSPTPSAT